MGSDTGGCVVTDDDELAERIRFIGQSRGAEMEPGFGRKHAEPGHAFRMAQCTAAICLAQLEIIREQVAHRNEMVRLLSRLVAEIPGLTPLPVPDYQEVYSCWMFAFTMDPGAFRCTNDEFAQQLEEVIPCVGTGRYYLMPAACTFLDEYARRGVYPYSIPPASRTYRYGAGSCPNARDFLDRMIRWSTFCEKYTPQDCELAAETLRRVADRNRA
jgi:dTDP-4-amino-4,6-dideoxygalactose transaminase